MGHNSTCEGGPKTPTTMKTNQELVEWLTAELLKFDVNSAIHYAHLAVSILAGSEDSGPSLWENLFDKAKFENGKNSAKKSKGIFTSSKDQVIDLLKDQISPNQMEDLVSLVEQLVSKFDTVRKFDSTSLPESTRKKVPQPNTERTYKKTFPRIKGDDEAETNKSTVTGSLKKVKSTSYSDAVKNRRNCQELLTLQPPDINYLPQNGFVYIIDRDDWDPYGPNEFRAADFKGKRGDKETNDDSKDFDDDEVDDVPELLENTDNAGAQYVSDEPEKNKNSKFSHSKDSPFIEIMRTKDAEFVKMPETATPIKSPVKTCRVQQKTCGTEVMNEDHHFRPIELPDQQTSEPQQDEEDPIIASPLAMLQDVVESYTLHLQRNPWETPNYGQLFGTSIWSNAANNNNDSWSMDLINIEPRRPDEIWSSMLYPRNEVLYDFNEMNESLDIDALEANSSQQEEADSTGEAFEWPVHEPLADLYDIWCGRDVARDIFGDSSPAIADGVPVEASGVLGAEPDAPVKPWTPWNGPDLDHMWRMMIPDFPESWGMPEPEPEPDFSRETCPVLAQFIHNGTTYGNLNQLNGDLPELPSPTDPNVRYCEDMPFAGKKRRKKSTRKKFIKTMWQKVLLEQSGPPDQDTENVVSWLISSQDGNSKCLQCGQLTAEDWPKILPLSCCDLAGAPEVFAVDPGVLPAAPSPSEPDLGYGGSTTTGSSPALSDAQPGAVGGILADVDEDEDEIAAAAADQMENEDDSASE